MLLCLHLRPRPAADPRTDPRTTISACAASIDSPLALLRQCAAPLAERPTPAEATQALALVANAGVHPNEWAPVLSSSRWRPIFSAKPGSLKAAAADGRASPRPPGLANAPPGRFFHVEAAQTFGTDGRVEDAFRLLWGAVRLSLVGAYELNGRRMTLKFDTLRVALLFGLLRFRLDIRDGGRLRSFVERRVRPRGAEGQPFRKRPTVYSWCFADDGLCVAQVSAPGRAGSVAVWAAVPAAVLPDEQQATPAPAPAPGPATGPAGRNGGAAQVRMRARSPPRRRVAPCRARPAAMVHGPAELQLGAALVLPLLAYKASAVAQRVQLQWYLDASIALAAASLIVYAAS